MKAISEIKQYHLTTEEIEAMLQANYGNSIKPVDQGKLQKQRVQLQRQATLAANLLAKDKLAEEPGEEELKELVELEEVESL